MEGCNPFWIFKIKPLWVEKQISQSLTTFNAASFLQINTLVRIELIKKTNGMRWFFEVIMMQ
jgi:hypothetical protein